MSTPRPDTPDIPDTPEPADSPDARTPSAEQRYVEQVRAFQVHAAIFAVSTIAIFLFNLLVNLSSGLTGKLSAWWSLWVLIGWGLGIAIHGIVVRFARPVSPSSTTE